MTTDRAFVLGSETVELASDRVAAVDSMMSMAEAIAYTRIPAGTFRKWVAAGRIPAHGGRRKLFHRDELDAALGYSSRPTLPP